MGNATGETASLTLAAVGDILLNDAARLPNPIFDVIAAADIACGNLEVVLTRSTEGTEKLITLRVDPEVGHNVAAMGFDVLCTANNHAGDFGPVGLRDNLAAVRAAGLAPVGTGENLDESLTPHIATVGDQRIAFLGVSTQLPNGSAAGPARPGMAPVRILNRYVPDPVTMEEAPGMSPFVETQAVAGDVARVCAAIRDAAAQADRVVVNIHWGVPLGWIAAHQDEIAGYQQPLARAMIDAGASAIIGHGPHMLQVMEFHNGAPIYYSTGNFIFHNVLPEDLSPLEAHPPYDWRSLKTVWNAIGGIARVRWAPGQAAPVTDLLIIRLNEIGEPRAGSKADAEQVRDRLAEQLKRRGANVAVKADGDYWTLAFSPAG